MGLLVERPLADPQESLEESAIWGLSFVYTLSFTEAESMYLGMVEEKMTEVEETVEGLGGSFEP